MKKSLISLSIIGLGTAAVLFATPKVLAYRGDPAVQGPSFSPERHEAMTQAFNNNDYNAWKELMQGKGRVTEIVNEGNFARFSEMHKLMLEGKTDEANQIRAELGLGQGNGYGRRGMGRYGGCANQ